MPGTTASNTIAVATLVTSRRKHRANGILISALAIRPTPTLL
jgi:hypothetical protein